jgi:aminopeptidase YwaD
MFHRYYRPIAAEISGPTAFQHVREISSYHRIQASPGFRQAAAYTHKEFLAAGLQVETLTYPAAENARYWSQKMFQEWECTDAELTLLSPEQKRLASFQENKISLIQRSGPTPAEGIEAEVVLIEDADHPDAYKDQDVKGKIIMASGDLERIRQLAVDEHGAIGIITDAMSESLPVRHRMDVADAVQYTSFWWSGQQNRCFGFVLSPKEGELLRRMLKKQNSSPVRVRAVVRSRFYDGSMEVVSAAIPGTGEGEIMVIAHLCHPQACANDNASGSGLTIEIARTLNTLIQKGKIPPPQRTIRFLLVPEFTGTYAYLADDESRCRKIAAAINLDMVGENQDLCKSSLMIERPPVSTPSFASELLEAIMEELTKEVGSIGGSKPISLFRHGVMPYSGGSDHGILADPSVNIPTPMLIQWPDKFYHTSADTIDKVDPESLRRVGTLTAVYAAFLASADYSDLVWLASEMTGRYSHELQRQMSALLSSGLEKAAQTAEKEESAAEVLANTLQNVDRKSTFMLRRKEEDLQSLLGLLPPDAQSTMAQVLESLNEQLIETTVSAQCRARMIARNYLPAVGECCVPDLQPDEMDEWEKEAAAIVPVRTYPGPIMARGHLDALTPDERESYRLLMRDTKNAYTLTLLGTYWMDGNRTLKEVADLVELEDGRRCTELLVRYIRFMDKAGLIQSH